MKWLLLITLLATAAIGECCLGSILGGDGDGNGLLSGDTGDGTGDGGSAADDPGTGSSGNGQQPLSSGDAGGDAGDPLSGGAGDGDGAGGGKQPAAGASDGGPTNEQASGSASAQKPPPEDLPLSGAAKKAKAPAKQRPGEGGGGRGQRRGEGDVSGQENRGEGNYVRLKTTTTVAQETTREPDTVATTQPPPVSEATTTATTTQQPETTTYKCGNVINEVLGEVKVNRYDPAHYNSRNGGPIVVDGKLDCDFDESDCCWRNGAPPSDELEWNVASGEIDQQTFKENFDTDKLPDGNFLIVASPCGEDPVYEAQFISCSISSTDVPVRVSLLHWETSDVQLAVCVRQSFYGDPQSNPLLHCVDVPKSSIPGPFVAELPPGDAFDVVIVAKNFVNPAGDVALIDAVSVDYVVSDKEEKTPSPPTTPTTTEEPLTTTTETTTTETTTTPYDPQDECFAVNCDFEKGGICMYIDESEGRKFFQRRGDVVVAAVRERLGHVVRNEFSETHVSIIKWTNMKGRFRNYVTGIYKAGQLEHYAASYLKKEEKSVIFTDVNFREARVIRFMYYEATRGISLKTCCDSLDSCHPASDPEVDVDDRGWKTSNVVCPAGTTKVYFLCENMDKLQGACGIDHIQLYTMKTSETTTTIDGETTMVTEGGQRTIVPLCPESDTDY